MMQQSTQQTFRRADHPLAIATLAAIATALLAPTAKAEDIGLNFDIPDIADDPPPSVAELDPETQSPGNADMHFHPTLDAPPPDSPEPLASLDPGTAIAPQSDAPSPFAHAPEGRSPDASSLTADIRVARIPDGWWTAGSDSPLAIALGAAEGTRRPDGGKNPAYYWHRDPGNGADNFGTFSYQHFSPREKSAIAAAYTPEQKRQAAERAGLPHAADRRQLERLNGFYAQLRQQAIAKGMSLSLEELVNGIDLANQSPQAALSWMGYLDRLEQMQRLVKDSDEQIQEARTWSYWHPTRNRWAAPGLGNTYESIRRDQSRRFEAIRQALRHSALP